MDSKTQKISRRLKASPVYIVAKRVMDRIITSSKRERAFVARAAAVSALGLLMLAVPYIQGSSAGINNTNGPAKQLASLLKAGKVAERHALPRLRSRKTALAKPKATKTAVTAVAAPPAPQPQPPAAPQQPAQTPAPPAPPGGDLTNTVGVDYAWSHPASSDIVGHNYRFVARYLSTDTSKNLSAPETADLKAKGLPIVTVWETGQTRALSGAPGGVADATAALAQANALGQPANAPIYFAVDFENTPQQLSTIDDYLKGAASVVGASRVGVYGSYSVVNHSFDIGTAKYGWQAAAWSSGQKEPRAQIYQDGRVDFGGGADLNIAQQSYIGQW
ncbi:MAG: DUF1906 domain-containing protein [Actinomycetota bacterium]|nr:DUF1906 domain-containing protein [Actinomycetota bacterium]